GRAKMHIVRKGLALRRELAELFRQPAYVPLYADGGKEENICAFALRDGSRTVIAVAPRFFATLMRESDLAPLGATAWGDATLELPEGTYENVLTGEKHEAKGRVRLAELLAVFPVALLTRAAPA